MAAYVRAKADAKLHNYSDYWGDLESDAASLLITTPAPDGPALLFKLEYLFGDVEREPDGYGASYCGEWMSAIMADARRLLSAGRA